MATPTSSHRLSLLLAMAMFVLVVDTSLMNVSISAVVRDLDTTVSGVQSESVGALLALGVLALSGFIYWLVRRRREGKPTLIDPNLFRSKVFRLGITGQMLQQIALGGTMIALPIYLQMVLEYDAMEAGLSLAPLSLVVLVPIVPRADSGWALLIPLMIAGVGMGLLVSQLNNYTLAPISEERVSEAAGVNSAAGSFGLSFGLAFAGAIMLATLSFAFTDMAQKSTVLDPAQQERVAQVLEDDAQVLRNTELDRLLIRQTPEVRAEIIRINTDARPRALQVALLIPILAGLLGLLNAFRMVRIPDPVPTGSTEAAAFV